MTNANLEDLLSKFSKEDYCYLTTKGRKTGKPHQIEIWFCVHETSLYLLSGGGDKSDWVKNLLNDPNVTVRIAGQTFQALARLLEDEVAESMIRMQMAIKYNEWEDGRSPSKWARTALVVAVTPSASSGSSS
jgi:deazaflavin-dependent oxidoreductase (nitroreductase family)